MSGTGVKDRTSERNARERIDRRERERVLRREREGSEGMKGRRRRNSATEGKKESEERKEKNT